MHALWGIEPAPERLATGTELGEIADDIGDELLALHGHMWRIRELLAQGDVDAVNEEIARFRARDTGPVHPLEASYAFNVTAMMALVAGDFETAERLGPAGPRGGGGPQRAGPELLRGPHGLDLVAAWRPGVHPTGRSANVLDQAPAEYPTVVGRAGPGPCRGGRHRGRAGPAAASLAALGWDNVADDQAEGVSLALAAAACSVLGCPGEPTSRRMLYEAMRPYAGTAVVVRAPAAACVGPADHYLGLLAEAYGGPGAGRGAPRGRPATRPSHGFTTLSWPPPRWSWPDTVRRRRPAADEERVAALLRSAEEAAHAMGLHRLAQRAAAPG